MQPRWLKSRQGGDLRNDTKLGGPDCDFKGANFFDRHYQAVLDLHSCQPYSTLSLTHMILINASLSNPPSKVLLQVRVNDINRKRAQTTDINDSLIQVDEPFYTKVLSDRVLTIYAMFGLRVDECADRADVIWRVEPGSAIGCGDSGFVGWDIGRQEEDDDVEAGFESVFLYPNSNAPVWS